MNEQKIQNQYQQPILSDIWGQLPKHEPILIKNTLRRFQKMLITGPSKSCKTTMAIQLAIAIIEGTMWLENDCYKGKVLYVNLDSSVATLFTRFHEIYEALETKANSLENINILNLKGNMITNDYVKFVEYLVTAAENQNYNLIIIDSIDYLLEGDDSNHLLVMNRLLDGLMFKTGTCLALVTTNDESSLLSTNSDTVVEVIPTGTSAIGDYRLSIKANLFKPENQKVLKFDYPAVRVIGTYDAENIQHANNLKREKSNNEFIQAFEKLSPNGEPIPVMDVANYLKIRRESLYRKVKKIPGFQTDIGMIVRLNNE